MLIVLIFALSAKLLGELVSPLQYFLSSRAFLNLINSPKQCIHLRCSDLCPPTSTILNLIFLRVNESFYLKDIFLYLNSMSQIPVVGTLERRISFKIKIRKGTLILGTLPDDLVCNRFLLFDPNFQEN